jgi:acetoin utilization deacetylase AcuC-like enzyme
LQAEHPGLRLVILDLDVHQGNGTAAVFAADPTVFTFSVHGAKNFPFHKEQSDLDIALPDGSDDAAFLAAVKSGVPRAISQAQAGLAIYIAGADPFVDDRLGRLAMTKPGLAERDRFVLELCRSHRLPVAVVMGGGYARDVKDVVDIHLQTIRLAAQAANGAGGGLAQKA